MMWSLHVLFQINCIVTKRRERLRASGVVSLFHLFFLMDHGGDLDCFLIGGDTIARIVDNYTLLTGRCV